MDVIDDVCGIIFLIDKKFFTLDVVISQFIFEAKHFLLAKLYETIKFAIKEENFSKSVNLLNTFSPSFLVDAGKQHHRAHKLYSKL